MEGCCISLSITTQGGILCLVVTYENREFSHPLVNGVSVHHAFEQLIPLVRMALWRKSRIHIQWVKTNGNEAFYSYEFEEVLDRFDLDIVDA